MKRTQRTQARVFLYALVNNSGVSDYIGCTSRPIVRERLWRRLRPSLKFKIIKEIDGFSAFAEENNLIIEQRKIGGASLNRYPKQNTPDPAADSAFVMKRVAKIESNRKRYSAGFKKFPKELQERVRNLAFSLAKSQAV